MINFNTPLSEIEYTVVDTETTGLYANRGARIVEIAATKVLPNLTLDIAPTFTSLIKQDESISQESIAIHGITDDMVGDAPEESLVMQGFLSYVGSSVLVAHNAPFDIAFIKSSLIRCGLNYNIGHVMDTVAISRKIYPRLRSHSLDSLIEHFKINVAVENECRHRALFDAQHTAIIFLKLVEEMDKVGVYTLGDLYEFLEQ